jgi:hypothetical protein
LLEWSSMDRHRKWFGCAPAMFRSATSPDCFASDAGSAGVHTDEDAGFLIMVKRTQTGALRIA